MYKKDPKLGIWVHSQRKFYKKNELCEERISHLESIGFVWNPHDEKWTAMYHKLVEYKRHHHGLTTVPQRYTEDPVLGKWVQLQRQSYRNSELSEERINHLESIGFVWSLHDVQWTTMYNKLVEYKRQHHGSTLVPQRYTEDPSLGKWVYNQSYAYNKGNLSGKRLKLLNAINFVWSAKKNSSS